MLAGRNCALSKGTKPSPIASKNLAPMGPGILSNAGTGVWNWEIANGGQNVSGDFGGRKRTIESPLQNQRSQKVGFIWSVPVPLRKNDRV